MSKKIIKIIAIFVVGMVGGIFADQIFWPYFVERPLFYQYKLEQSPVYVTEKKETIIQENTAITDAIEKVEKTIIGIRTQTATSSELETITLEGSGLIVTSDGLIVTLASLVPQGSDFGFFVDGKQVAYQILKRDLKENLSLVKIEQSNLQTAGFADLEKIKTGEKIFSVGIIFDDKKPLLTVNEGIIKNFDENLIATNIREKNTLSGSSLFNVKGEVLGLNSVNADGEMVAIPISKIKTFIGM